MIKLRDYQTKFLHEIYHAWESYRAILGVLPTGGGKTTCFSKIIHDHKGASATVVHRKEIVRQISLSLAGFDVKHRVIGPPDLVRNIRRNHLKKYGKSFIDDRALAGVASVQTLTSKSSAHNTQLQAWLNQVTLAVLDEAHHYVKASLWGKVLDIFDTAKLLGVTATPERADGKGLGAHADGFAEVMIQGPTTQQLIDWGYLSPFKYFAPKTGLDLSDVPLTASGEVNTREMRKRIEKSELVGEVVTHYKQFAQGKRAIIFANDVATAHEHESAFNGAEIKSVAVSGGTDSGPRDKAIEDFEAIRLYGLINVDLFDEGFDVPGVDAVIMARRTESLAKYLQMVGRALRPVYADGYDLSTIEGRKAAIAAGPKPYAIIIDAVRNAHLGLPHYPRYWTLDSAERKAKSKSGEKLVYCEKCTQPYEPFYKQCPYCGHIKKPSGRSAPEQVDGDLAELDLNCLSDILKRIERAKMPDEAYIQDQISRRIPEIGRPRDLRRHRAARERIKVLDELVAFWVGAQPDRELNEVHRRFYHRFDVDIGNAFTLNEKQTNELISTIMEKFSDDLQ